MVFRLLRPSRSHRGERDRGAVAVEAAFITPVLLLLVFGMVDFSLLIKDNVAVVSAVRSGARVASAEASLPGSVTTKGYVPGFASDTVSAMNSATTNLNRTASVPAKAGPPATSAVAGTQLFLSLVPAGSTPPDIGDSCGSVSNCMLYAWDTGVQKFVLESSSWVRGSADSCPASSTNVAGPDAVRVTLHSPHDFLTPMFFGHWKLNDSAVMNFEPQPLSVCGSTT